MGMQMPTMGGSMFSGAQAPTFQFNQLPTGLGANNQSVVNLLSQPNQSLTNQVMPYLQQLYGTSAGLTQNIFSQQGAQGAAQAQSDAMKRGLTGSSIEAANMQGAYANANQGFNQYLAQLMPQLGQAAMGSMQFDIGQQTSQNQNLAQAYGQWNAQNIQQQQFEEQLSAMTAASQQANRDSLWGAGIGAVGSMAGGAAAGFAGRP
jgi:hypothetical protein